MYPTTAMPTETSSRRRHLPLAPVLDIKRFSHLIGRKIKSELIKTLE